MEETVAIPRELLERTKQHMAAAIKELEALEKPSYADVLLLKDLKESWAELQELLRPV